MKKLRLKYKRTKNTFTPASIACNFEWKFKRYLITNQIKMVQQEAEVFAKIQAVLDTVDPNKPDRKVVHVFKIKITQNGEVVKTMVLDLVKIKFYEGDDEAECTLTIPDDILADVVLNKAETTGLITSGKVTVDGDVELAKLLGATLSQ